MHIERKSMTKFYLKKDNKLWEVAESEVERDLGILVSNDLKWEPQCKKAAAQGYVYSGHDENKCSFC